MLKAPKTPPILIITIISITGTNAPAGYYYFFYDWEIEKDECVSNISSVSAVINNSFTLTQNLDICFGDTVFVGNNFYIV